MLATLQNASGTAVNISGATVRFSMRKISGEVVVSRAAATVVDATTGSVRYNWQAADTANAGAFQAEFEVTYSDDSVETFPNDGYIPVIITDDVA
jgi:hypothetical protein